MERFGVNRYETLFGAATEDEIEADTLVQDIAATPVDLDLLKGFASEEFTEVTGDEPDIRFGFGNNEAHSESIRNIMTLPLESPAFWDCPSTIGDAMVQPLFIQNEPVSADCDAADAAETAEVSNHDQTGDMVNAVISDLKSFMTDARKRTVGFVTTVLPDKVPSLPEQAPAEQALSDETQQ